MVFLYLIFSIRIDLFSIFFIFFRKLRVTRRIPQLLLVVQEEERGSFVFVRFVFHVWEHDFIVQLVSCCMWDFHFLFSFRWRLRQTQTSATRWIDGTWSLCKQKYFSDSFFWFDICVFIFIYLNFPMSFDKTLNKKLFFKLMISGLKLFVSTSLTVQYFRIFFFILN